MKRHEAIFWGFLSVAFLEPKINRFASIDRNDLFLHENCNIQCFLFLYNPLNLFSLTFFVHISTFLGIHYLNFPGHPFEFIIRFRCIVYKQNILLFNNFCLTWHEDTTVESILSIFYFTSFFYIAFIFPSLSHSLFLSHAFNHFLSFYIHLFISPSRNFSL